MRYFVFSLFFCCASFAAESDFVSGLGSSKIILSRDLEVPANQDYVDLPVKSVSGSPRQHFIGYGIHIDTWVTRHFMCRVHFAETSSLRRKYDSGSILQLTGECVEKVSPTTNIKASCFTVSSPSSIKMIAFGSYDQSYRSLMGEKIRAVSGYVPSETSIGDFRYSVSSIGKLILDQPQEAK